MVRRLLLALAALLALVGPAPAAPPPDLRLWVEVDHEGPIYPQEMVLLRVHGRFMIPIALEKMEDPPLEGFRSMRIDRDHWSDVFEDGLTQRAFERVVAVFPQRSGRLTIPPYVHHLTVLDRTMKQVRTDLASAPVTIEVAPAPAPADSWWIAAAELTLSDAWSKEPAGLDIGQSTRRTITLTAKGVFDDQLPPPPAVKAEGLVVFPGPTERSTRVGLGRATETMPLREQVLRRKGRLEEVATAFAGPLATVAYTYDIRPSSGSPVTLPEIRIPWYDTVAKTTRVAVLPARTVALKDAATDAGRLEAALGIAPGADAGPPRGGRAGGLASVLIGTAAFVVALAGLGAGLRPPALIAAVERARAARLRRQLRGTVRRAARRGDLAATRAALVILAAKGGPEIAARCETALAAIDRHLFAARSERPADLVGLTAAVA